MDLSVKVGIRVRPLSSNDINDGYKSCITYPIEKDRLIIARDKIFAFDYVFNEAADQEEVYCGCARPLVDSVLNGYNATIFAYGQTGSGKTHTMGTADAACCQNPGIIPRIIGDIFSSIPSKPYDYTVRVSFMEIYNEEIHDLLSQEGSVLSIREDGQMIKIVNLQEHDVSTCSDVMHHLQAGSIRRVVASTAMNDSSSRSHAIFTLHMHMQPKVLETENVDNEEAQSDTPAAPLESLKVKLHLVDLAGSERVKKTLAEGDRFKEGININLGLLALGNVINALGERGAGRRAHVPYRDSKLTRILQDSLGGNSTTLMLACVSPADNNFEETLNTLRYADRARFIKNIPVLNRAESKEAELVRLRALVLQLQSQLKQSGGDIAIGVLKTAAAAPITSVETSNSNFSAEVMADLLATTRKLEEEKRSVTAELDNAIERSTILIREKLRYHALWDSLSELFRQHLPNIKEPEMTVARRQFMILVESQSKSDPDDVLLNAKLDEALAQSSIDQQHLRRKRLAASLDDGGTASKKVKQEPDSRAGRSARPLLRHASLTQLPVTAVDEALVLPRRLASASFDRADGNSDSAEDDAETAPATGDNVVDQQGNELRNRRLASQRRVALIEADLQGKANLLASLREAGDQGDESYSRLLARYDAQVGELEARVNSLETERASLITEITKMATDGLTLTTATGSKSGANGLIRHSEKAKQLAAMERELTGVKRQLTELSRLKKAKEARETECRRLQTEIQSCKVAMVRSMRQLGEESAAYRKWKQQKEQEVRRLQEHDRRMQSELTRMAVSHERQTNVLRRRAEAAAAAERRLKEVLQRQQGRAADRREAGAGNRTAPHAEAGARVRSWLKTDIDLQVGVGEAQIHLGRLVDSRRILCDELRTAELRHHQASHANPDAADAGPTMVAAELGALRQQVDEQSQQIANMQQKLVDAGSSSGPAVASVNEAQSALTNGPTTTSSKLLQLHNIADMRVASKYLFQEVVAARVSKSDLETQFAEAELQLSLDKTLAESLRLTTAELSTSQTEIGGLREELQLAKTDLASRGERIARLEDAKHTWKRRYAQLLAKQRSDPRSAARKALSQEAKPTAEKGRESDDEVAQEKPVRNLSFTLTPPVSGSAGLVLVPDSCGPPGAMNKLRSLRLQQGHRKSRWTGEAKPEEDDADANDGENEEETAGELDSWMQEPGLGGEGVGDDSAVDPTWLPKSEEMAARPSVVSSVKARVRHSSAVLPPRVVESRTRESIAGVSGLSMCKCRSGCSTQRCGCQRSGRGCSSACKCTRANCANQEVVLSEVDAPTADRQLMPPPPGAAVTKPRRRRQTFDVACSEPSLPGSTVAALTGLMEEEETAPNPVADHTFQVFSSTPRRPEDAEVAGAAFNRTFNCDSPFASGDKENDTRPVVASPDAGAHAPWKAGRMSYFPSPSLCLPEMHKRSG